MKELAPLPFSLLVSVSSDGENERLRTTKAPLISSGASVALSACPR